MTKKQYNPFFKLALILTTILLTQKGIATINVREGSFYHTTIDSDHFSQHDDFQLVRTYRSRSSHLGYFGFGWCSNFEMRLKKKLDGSFTLLNCSVSEEIQFRQNPTLPGEWIATNQHKRRLTRSNGRLLHQLENGSSQIFSEEHGRLIGIIDHRGRSFNITYRPDGRIEYIKTSNGAALKFIFDDDRGSFISRVISSHGDELRYLYRGNDLIQVETKLKSKSRAANFLKEDVDANKITYDFDNFHNLLRVWKNSEVTDEITYDDKLDRVVRATQFYSKSERCTEILSYIDGKNFLEVNLNTQCDKSNGEHLKNHKKFSFLYQIDKQNKLFLSRMRIDSQKQFLEVYFDPQEGNSIALNRNGTISQTKNLGGLL